MRSVFFDKYPAQKLLNVHKTEAAVFYEAEPSLRNAYYFRIAQNGESETAYGNIADFTDILCIITLFACRTFGKIIAQVKLAVISYFLLSNIYYTLL